MSAGGWHTLVLKTDGSVWVTGANSDGQLGEGTEAGSKFFEMAIGAFRASANDCKIFLF